MARVNNVRIVDVFRRVQCFVAALVQAASCDVKTCAGRTTVYAHLYALNTIHRTVGSTRCHSPGRQARCTSLPFLEQHEGMARAGAPLVAPVAVRPRRRGRRRLHVGPELPQRALDSATTTA